MPSGDEEILEAMFEASPDAVIVVGAEGTIEMASPAAESLFGYRVEELVGAGVELLLPDSLRELHIRHRRRFDTDPVSRSMGVGLDLRARRKDGSVFPVDVSLAPTNVAGRLRVGAFVRDASERRRGEDLLRAVNEMSRRLLAGEPTGEMLALASRQARSLVGASLAWIAVHDRANAEVAVVAADGESATALLGEVVPAAGSLAVRAVTDGETVVVSDMTADPDVLPAARAAGLGPGIYLPMLAEDGPVGALVVARERGAAAFGESDLKAAEVFASAAAIVLALGRAREALEAGRITAEHERIARDLHDTVIQRLFALGMSLQAAERHANPEVADRIRSTVDAIDEVIREIRETIFDLNRPDTDAPNLRRRVRKVAAEAAEPLGFAPRVGFRGPVEAAVSDDLAQQLLSVLREALSNVSRHARASTVDVVLNAGGGSITLSVADDGIGPSPGPTAGHGLENMADRARQLGGDMAITPRSPGGTLLQWTVPVRS
jgi:PAS domain S-box-containing protein